MQTILMSSYQVDPQMVDALVFCISVIICLFLIIIAFILGDIVTTISHRREVELLNSWLSKLEELVVSDYLRIKNDGGLDD